jgi:deoxyadenosine/deoxycytidine kinase
MVLLVSIEGNIGSGKSHLLRQLQQHYLSNKTQSPSVYVLPEDVSGWTSFQDNNGCNILEMYYKEPAKYSYCFQSLVLTSRIAHVHNILTKDPDCVLIMERTHHTDRQIFVESLKDKSAMTEMEYLTYQKMFELINSTLNQRIDMLVYNQTSPEVCMERIAKRQRKGEDLILKQFIEELHQRHESWLSTEHSTSVYSQMMVLSGDVDADSQDRELQINLIVSKIQDLYNLKHVQTLSK